MGRVIWNDNSAPDGADLLSAILMESELLERIDDVIRRRRNTDSMTITLSSDFDWLCDALEKTETMTVKQAYEHLRRAGAEVDMDSQLKIWWLRCARDRLIAAAERQAVDSPA